MKLQDQKSLQLTAKQRLAVSREALIKASRQNLWQGVTGLAAKGVVNWLERFVADHKGSNSKK